MNEMGEQMSIFDQDIWCGKTSPEHSVATKAKTSESSLKNSQKSQTKMPLYLCLRKTNGQPADASSDVVSQSRRDKKKTRTDRDVDVDVDVVDTATATTEQKQLKCIGGMGKNVVYLTDNQFDSLLDSLGIDAFDRYIERLADFIIDKKAHVKNHYETILKWYHEDSNC